MKQIDRDNILISLQAGQLEMSEKIDVISRGVHGDEKNKALGLIDRQAKDDEKFEIYQTQMLAMNTDIQSNTRFRKKVSKITAISTGGGITATTVSAIAFFKEIKQFFIGIFN